MPESLFPLLNPTKKKESKMFLVSHILGTFLLLFAWFIQNNIINHANLSIQRLTQLQNDIVSINKEISDLNSKLRVYIDSEAFPKNRTVKFYTIL